MFAAVWYLAAALLVMTTSLVTADVNSQLVEVERAETPLHIVAISIPAYGHFMPVKGIAEKLLLRGHNVTLLVETAEWCESALPGNLKFGCIIMPKSHTFARSLFTEMSAIDDVGSTFNSIFDEMFRHHKEQLSNYVQSFEALQSIKAIDVILMDLSTLVGFSLSAKFNIPKVSVLPLTISMAVGQATHLPVLGTAFPRDMSFSQRYTTFIARNLMTVLYTTITGQLNPHRAEVGIAPFTSPVEITGLDGLIFAPTIWGYDIPQPLCPNVVPLGAFSPSVEHEPMETSLITFLDGCPQGAIYVNFGTLAVVGDAMMERVQAALIAAAPHCVVWKVVEAPRREELQSTLLADEAHRRRFFVASRFNNPISIMNHPNMRVFLTHCGDTSVLEAIQAELPLAGIPFFADQADVCQRMQESGIGIYVGHKHRFEVRELTEALVSLASNTAVSERARTQLKRIHRMSNILGGAERAAEIIEHRVRNGLLSKGAFLEECAFLSPSGPVSLVYVNEYDFLIPQVLFGVVLLSLLWKRCCC